MHTPNWFDYIKFLFVENDMPKTKTWIHSEMFMRGSGGGGGQKMSDFGILKKFKIFMCIFCCKHVHSKD